MNNKRLMARMGNGLLREVKDSAEAEQIRRETGDEGMFVFYEDRKQDKSETKRPSWAKTTMAATPNEKQNKGIPTGAKTTAPFSGPRSGHAAATLNPDGSTQIRLLDQGMDPKVPVNQGGKSKAYNPIKDMTQRMHKIGANTDRTNKAKSPDERSALSLLDLGPEEYEQMMNHAKKNKTYSQYQIQNADPETVGYDHEIGFEKPKTAVGRMYQGVGSALSQTGEAIKSEEMRKGVKFGTLAALEVMKEAGMKAGKDGFYSWALSRLLPDDDILLNLAANVGLLTKEGVGDYYGEFEELGTRVGKNIQDIKKDVYGDKKP